MKFRTFICERSSDHHQKKMKKLLFIMLSLRVWRGVAEKQAKNSFSSSMPTTITYTKQKLIRGSTVLASSCCLFVIIMKESPRWGGFESPPERKQEGWHGNGQFVVTLKGVVQRKFSPSRTFSHDRAAPPINIKTKERLRTWDEEIL